MMRNYFIKDFIFLNLIILLPFSFFLYIIVPDESSVSIFNVLVESGFYESIQTLAWYSVNYFLAFLLYCIWFLTCKSWWRHAIFVLIYSEFRKIFMMIDDTNHIVTSELVMLLFGIIFIIVLLILSNRIGYYSYQKSMNKKLDDEIDILMTQVSNFKMSNYKIIRLKLVELRNSKNEYDQKEYLIKLLKLQEELLLIK